MRKMLIVLLSLLLVCAAAYAQETATQIAVTAPQGESGMTPLYDAADDASGVLMNYYATTPVEVIDDAGDYAKVRVGSKGVYLTGYMRKDELRFGAAAMRETERYVVDLYFDGAKAVYAEPREDAPVLYTMEYATFFTIGENEDGWVQIAWPLGDTGDGRGFIKLSEGEMKAPEPMVWHVLPLEGELSYKEARERAIEIAIECAAGLGMDEAFTTREGLEGMAFDIRLLHSIRQTAYTVYINIPGDPGGKGISLTMTPQGVLLTIEPCLG